MKFLQSKGATASLSWKSLFISTVLAAAAYVFMEWLFIVTRPSFMDMLSIWKKLEVLFLSSFLLAGLFALPMLLLPAIQKLPRFQAAGSLVSHLFALLPAVLLAAVMLLMLDNFTYTLFRFGIVSSTGITRVVYLLLFLVMVFYSYKNILRWTRQWGNEKQDRTTNRLVLVSACVILISYGFAFLLNPLQKTGLNALSGAQGAKSPNILILTSDGVSAEHMSVYGYERETTPRLKALAKDFLFVENAFSNAGNTAGSITSLLTGKYPAETRVLYPPDILKGTDAYQHLPGILKSLHYNNTEFGHPHYVDAFTFNFQDAFDRVNGRAAASNVLWSGLGRQIPYEVNYFLFETSSRILGRLGHIFFIKKMENPYDLVTEPPDAFKDQEKVQQVLELLKNPTQPQFIHLHLTGTHGPVFHPRVQVFSKGQRVEDQDYWDTNFYQDSILEFDAYVGEIVDALVASGQYDNTILVIGSDHGRAYDQKKRIPMMIHFPGSAYAGRIKANVQNLDIAPTILDYMGVEKPAWMTGQSLLHGEIEQRPVIGVSVAVNLVEFDENYDRPVEDGIDIMSLNTERSALPFYQFEVVSVVYCQRLYVLNLLTHNLDIKDVRNYAGGCAEDEIIDKSEAFQLMVNHLQSSGFDTSSLDEKEILR